MAMSSEQPPRPGIPEIIRSEIVRLGRIPFHRFMELALYHPQFGYYSSDQVRLGKSGDFYTSAHTAPVFARILARHLEGSWHGCGEPSRFDLIELGPGDGLLASELLSWIGSRFPDFSSSLHYTGVEQSASMRSRLSDVIQPFGGRAKVVADWEEAAENSPGGAASATFILANEFFDALPVDLLAWRSDGWMERCVCLANGQFAWCEEPVASPELIEEAETRFAAGLSIADREEGWVAEIRLGAREWMERIGKLLARGTQGGELLVVDYGYTVEEWQRGRFPQGSALAYRRHQVHDDLLVNPGDQDLTAHVNFSELIEAGRNAGLRVERFESQAKFLMGLGERDQFGDVFSDCNSEPERLRRAQQLKTLILPQGMGEAFRVLEFAPAGIL